MGFIIQLFNKGKVKKEEGKIEEVLRALKYKDINQLYGQPKEADAEKQESKSELCKLLIKQFITAKNEGLAERCLEVLIASQFQRSEFCRYLENVFFIMNDQCQSKQVSLSKYIPQLAELISHSTNSLNVSDIKNLKLMTFTLDSFFTILSEIYSLFRIDTGTKTVDNVSKESMVINDKDIDPLFTKLFMKTKGYLVIIEFLKICTTVKLEAASNVLEGKEELGLHAVAISTTLLSVIELCNRILITFCRRTMKAKVRLLKHVARITLIPPPKDIYNDERWRLFTKISKTDIELINEICKGNNQIAYMNNQQVVYFKELVQHLNKCICKHNIDKIFQVFENIMDQTTHVGLYKEILGYFWENRRHIFM